MAIADGASHAAALRSRYSFGGFLAPVNMPPVVSTSQAGAAVPVKFSLGGNKGLDLFTKDYLASPTVWCKPDASTDKIEWTVHAGAAAGVMTPTPLPTPVSGRRAYPGPGSVVGWSCA